MNRESAMVPYQLQKNGAKRRGIGWEFTLETWMAVWQESGVWEQRGRGVGRYVMGRHGDVGPYSPENVAIIKFEQNSKDAHSNGRFLHPSFSMTGEIEGAPLQVPEFVINEIETYRDAVRAAWNNRKLSGMTAAMLATLIDSFPSHVTDYFHTDDASGRRDLPARLIPAFELVVGNTLVSQWLAAQSKLTVLEEIQATNQPRSA